jgi:ElaB/YqjD/DUF883 family membrane-anchored ribosome-binding protein
MNTETKAGHDAISLSERGGAQRLSLSYDSNKDKLLADLKILAADTEQLIKEAATASNERFTALRERFDTKLVETRAKLGDAKTAVGEKARLATDVTHVYIQENPWRSAGIIAAAGAIFGLLGGLAFASLTRETGEGKRR